MTAKKPPPNTISPRTIDATFPPLLWQVFYGLLFGLTALFLRFAEWRRAGR